MQYVHLAMAILAAWRLTEIVERDAVFNPVRRWLPRLQLFFSCKRCISVWMGALVTLIYYWWPWANWPFAISILYLTADYVVGLSLRRISIYIDQQRVDLGGLSTENGLVIMEQAIALVRQQVQRPKPHLQPPAA